MTRYVLYAGKVSDAKKERASLHVVLCRYRVMRGLRDRRRKIQWQREGRWVAKQSKEQSSGEDTRQEDTRRGKN